MGGDTVPLRTRSILDDDDSPLEQDFSQISSQPHTLIRDKLSTKTKDGEVDSENGWMTEEFDEVESRCSSAALDLKTNQRRRSNVRKEILESYGNLQKRSENLDDAKRKILSYTPGAWIEQVGGMKLSESDIPRTPSLILIGPKGSGKSSLINRISKVFEDDHLASDRAQVSYNSTGVDGTFFLQEYMIPRNSKSFCLYDTRSLSDDSSDNIEMLKQWMTNGVRNGELVTRKSDDSSLIDRMRCKARCNFTLSGEIRVVNFVIFVVNGLSVLKSIDSEDDVEKGYTKVITTAFNCPYLSFADDKPVVVMTHGDLLSLSDRVRVRAHLGNLLGISPTKQIFDIPEASDPVTELTIIDMLHYCLEHSDKYFPSKGQIADKDDWSIISARMYLIMAAAIVIVSALVYHLYTHRHPHKPKHHVPKAAKIVWHEIRHLWL